MPVFQRILKSMGLTSDPSQQAASNPEPDPPIPASLFQAISRLRASFGHSADLVIREWEDAAAPSRRVAVAYIEGIVDPKLLSKLVEAITEQLPSVSGGPAAMETRIQGKLPVGKVKLVHTEGHLRADLLTGNAVILTDGFPAALAASVPGGEKRGVEEPTSQTVIRGPKEGFTEDLTVNVSLLRRKLRTSDLRIERRTIGRYTQTPVVMAYIEGLADTAVLDEMRKRLDAIDTDSVLESGYIEELIQDKTWTPFPTMMNTERPDSTAGSLLEGQVALLVDGTPFVLLAPVTFFKFFQSSEDYYQRYDLSSFLRVIRLFAFFVAMLLPSLYIAVSTFHQEMMPSTLLVSLAAQREGTPLPALIEALLMEITFEVIREAGVRMPRAIGPAISIVGALVLGQAAVQAGLVSGAMVIVVSFTAIANFVIPAFNMAASVRLIRFGLMFLAGTLGLFGILAGAVPILTHVVNVRSFGVPYFTPLAPIWMNNWKDLVVRVPWPLMKTRPAVIGKQNRQRQGPKTNS
ncbi:spore germination protein [Cohnella candidum]|nr:spore germination protein [Cohnella candidum]